MMRVGVMVHFMDYLNDMEGVAGVWCGLNWPDLGVDVK